MLGVDGQQLTGAGQGHEKVAAADDGLLVGVGKGLAGLEGGVARVDAHEADQGVHHHVDVGKLRELGHGLLAEAYLAGGRKLAHDGVRGARRVGKGHVAGAELASRLDQGRGGDVGREGHHAHAVCVPAADVERLGAYGTRATKNGHPDNVWPFGARCRVFEDRQRIPPTRSRK